MTTPPFVVTLNPRRRSPVDLLDADLPQTLSEITTWPGYRSTPLHKLSDLADELGIGAVWYKDEGPRFGVGSFKPMGAGYAVARAIQRHLEAVTGRPKVTSVQLLAGTFRDLATDVTVACATDGNHGRAVAWAAKQFGCHSVVYLASHVSSHREDAIASFGARIVRTSGNHDEAVESVARDAKRNGWVVISETPRATDPQIALDIFAGYGALALEALRGLPEGEQPTHVFVQVGVGGLAEGCVHAMEAHAGGHPRIVTVEAASADSLRRSIEAEKRVSIDGDLHTVMAGLSAGVVSEYLWPVLQSGVYAAIAIEDTLVGPALQRLASGSTNDPAVEAGESGIAGLAALTAVSQDTKTRAALELTGSSRVLTIGTEGVTDPEVFERLVGRPPSVPVPPKRTGQG